MAKKAYVGVSGTPKNIKAIYVGVNGTPKKVVKGYVGVNGVPKLFWDDTGITITITTSIRNAVAPADLMNVSITTSIKNY